MLLPRQQVAWASGEIEHSIFMGTGKAPWNDWYHCMGHTYGTWLPGDPRSFRTRHHREHIVGDYKNPPPPGMYDKRHAKAKSLMTRPAVFLSDEQRAAAVDEFS